MTERKVKFVFPKDGDERIVAWPCTIHVPVDGGQEDQGVTARFRLRSGDELLEVLKKGEAALFDDVVVGFVDFTYSDGITTVPDELALKFFRGEPYARAGILASYYDMLSGRPLKN